MRNLRIVLCSIVLLSSIAFSQLTQQQIDNFYKKFNSPDRSRIAGLFSKQFLNAVPETKIFSILDMFKEKYGNFERAILKEGTKIEVIYEKATMPGIINFDNEGKVTTFWYGNPSMKEDSYDKIKEELKDIKGTISVCIRKNGKEIFSINKSQPLGVGSTFKLFVLKTLVNSINAGKEKWDKVIHLDPKFKSFPSGMLQSWPDNEPVTLGTLANLMISISDNTATDNLIAYLGRENIEKNAPVSMRPFYMTNEMFRLKLGKDSAGIEQYNKMDLELKRKELDVISHISLDSLDVLKLLNPTHLEIEWLVSTEQLCETIESLEGVKALSINPGLADKDNWYYVGYKGGSEGGVLNYTHLLRNINNSRDFFSISATVNNPDAVVDKEKEFTTIILRLIGLISKEK